MFTINGMVWKVRFVPPNNSALIMPDGAKAAGMCDSNTRTLYIDRTIHGSYLKEVLSHEIVHAGLFAYGIELDYETEEVVANIVAKYGREIIKLADSVFKKIKRGYY